MLWHSVMWQYLSDAERDRISAASRSSVSGRRRTGEVRAPLPRADASYAGGRARVPRRTHRLAGRRAPHPGPCRTARHPGHVGARRHLIRSTALAGRARVDNLDGRAREERTMAQDDDNVERRPGQRGPQGQDARSARAQAVQRPGVPKDAPVKEKAHGSEVTGGSRSEDASAQGRRRRFLSP